jgi:hypothetical protein
MLVFTLPEGFYSRASRKDMLINIKRWSSHWPPNPKQNATKSFNVTGMILFSCLWMQLPILLQASSPVPREQRPTIFVCQIDFHTRRFQHNRHEWFCLRCSHHTYRHKWFCLRCWNKSIGVPRELKSTLLVHNKLQRTSLNQMCRRSNESSKPK